MPESVTYVSGTKCNPCVGSLNHHSWSFTFPFFLKLSGVVGGESRLQCWSSLCGFEPAKLGQRQAGRPTLNHHSWSFTFPFFLKLSHVVGSTAACSAGRLHFPIFQKSSGGVGRVGGPVLGFQYVCCHFITYLRDHFFWILFKAIFSPLFDVNHTLQRQRGHDWDQVQVGRFFGKILRGRIEL
jgi:hypothetical protein